MKGKYGELLHEINTELKDLLKRLQQDKYAQVLTAEMTELRDVFSDSIFETLAQVRHLALPVIKELLRELHLPKIENQTDTSHYIIDNMILQGKEINLDDVSVNIKFGLKDLMKLEFEIKNIQGKIQGVNFTYDNFGALKWHDEGTFNCFLSVPKWKLKWIVKESKNQPPQFFLGKIDGNINQFSLDIEQAKHKFVDQMIVAWFSGNIKKRTELEIEKAMREHAQIITEKFNQMFVMEQKEESLEKPQEKTTISPRRMEQQHFGTITEQEKIREEKSEKNRKRRIQITKTSSSS